MKYFYRFQFIYRSCYLLIPLICILLFNQGCAHRLGAKIFSLKQKIEKSSTPSKCSKDPYKVEEKNEDNHGYIEPIIIKEPSSTDPKIIFSAYHHIVQRTMEKKYYKCNREVEWEVKGRYIYDPIEIGPYSTFLNYRQTAKRIDSEKTLADWIFLIGGWPFAGVDLLSFGIYGMTGGPIIDALVPAWENEGDRIYEFGDSDYSSFCKYAGPFTAVTVVMPFYCTFYLDIDSYDNVIEKRTERLIDYITGTQVENFTREGDWEVKEIKEDRVIPFSGNLIASIPDTSLTTTCSITEELPCVIDLSQANLSHRLPQELILSARNNQAILFENIRLAWTGKWKSSLLLRPQKKISHICLYSNEQNAISKRNCKKLSVDVKENRDIKIIAIKSLDGLYKVAVLHGSTQNVKYTFGYMPKDSSVSELLMLTRNDLDRLIGLLTDIGDFSGTSSKELRMKFVQSLRKALESITGKAITDESIKLTHFIKQNSTLPIRDDSPLFKYSISDLNNKMIVDFCVFRRLAYWVLNVKNYLEEIKANNIPKWHPTSFPGPQCPSGQHILYTENIEVASHTRFYDKLYCQDAECAIPKKYLP